MSDFLARLINARAESAPPLRPRLPSLFAPTVPGSMPATPGGERPPALAWRTPSLEPFPPEAPRAPGLAEQSTEVTVKAPARPTVAQPPAAEARWDAASAARVEPGQAVSVDPLALRDTGARSPSRDGEAPFPAPASEPGAIPGPVALRPASEPDTAAGPVASHPFSDSRRAARAPDVPASLLPHQPLAPLASVTGRDEGQAEAPVARPPSRGASSKMLAETPAAARASRPQLRWTGAETPEDAASASAVRVEETRPPDARAPLAPRPPVAPPSQPRERAELGTRTEESPATLPRQPPSPLKPARSSALSPRTRPEAPEEPRPPRLPSRRQAQGPQGARDARAASPAPAPQATPHETTTVRITIGRIEVRATGASPAPAPRPTPRSEPAMSLEAYLKRRGGGDP